MAAPKKKIMALVKLQIPAGQATPAPPVGPALGQHGANIMDFCKQFNAATQAMEPGTPTPVIITAFADRSFAFETKTPPAAYFLRKAAGLPGHLVGFGHVGQLPGDGILIVHLVEVSPGWGLWAASLSRTGWSYPGRA